MRGSRGAATIATGAGLWGGHPVRKMEGPAVRLPNQKMADAVMLILTDRDNGLPSQRMEWIGDDNVEARIPGIMTLLPSPSEKNSLRCKATACWLDRQCQCRWSTPKIGTPIDHLPERTLPAALSRQGCPCLTRNI